MISVKLTGKLELHKIRALRPGHPEEVHTEAEA